jgi:hypothetical protein
MTLLRTAAWLILVVSLYVPSLSLTAQKPPPVVKTSFDPNNRIPEGQRPKHVKSTASQWLDIALEATAREHERVAARPTIGSRMLLVIVNCM